MNQYDIKNDSIKNESIKELHTQINTRIYDRNVPSKMLQPYINVRPVSTKYELFPTTDRRKLSEVPLLQQPTYDNRRVFNPSDSAAWSGINVNLESDLRNQYYALQKSSQAVYVPNSTSDLYQYGYKNNSQNTNNSQVLYNQHKLLFETQQFNEFNPNPDKKVVGSSVFNNSTRTQLMEI
jgi:hypothetical protein